MAGPSKKKVTKKAPAKKAAAKKAPAKTKKVAATAEGQPMARQLENVTADSHYAIMTRGRGDCMYHAISDQLYGHQDAHAEIRATTAAFLRQHRALYRPFVPADLGAENRHSTRLTRGGALAELPPLPTEEELDHAFEAYVERYVAKPGKWGGDLELQALAGAFLVDIAVYQDHHAPWRQEPLDGVLPAGHRPEDRKLLRVAYYGGVHYASVRPLPAAAAAAPDPASPKRKRTPDRDPEEDEEDKARPRKKRAVAASASPSPSPSSPPPPPPPPPVVLQRQESPPPEQATPPAPAPSTSRPPSTWRSASCPPSKGTAMATAMATATAKRRPATRHTTPATTTITTITTTIPAAPALAPAARAVPAVPAAAAAAAADTSPADPVPARAPDNDDDDDDKCRLVHVRLAGIPGGDICISGMVRGHLTFTRAGEVLAAYAVEEEEG
ncbi:MAG: hypothetical protein M1826_006120 [Phylliscum demangeonii]|nr:MAG: hypothetical protein M1826_006120 [Phylliscum demangeonii]